MKLNPEQRKALLHALTKLEREILEQSRLSPRNAGHEEMAAKLKRHRDSLQEVMG